MHFHQRGELGEDTRCEETHNKKEVRSFLGLADYYRDHMPSFAAIAAPLSDLTKKRLPESVRWEDAQEKAFVTLRESMVRRPTLHLQITTRLLFCVPMRRTVVLGLRLCRNTKEDFFQSRTEAKS